MRKYVLAALASLSLLSTAGWANVHGAPAMPSQTGPNFRTVTETIGPMWTWPIDKEARSPVWTEARSPVQTKGRAAHIGAAWKSAMSERSAELGGL
jgi:hypothetical protein